MNENTIGEFGDKKAFVGGHDSPVHGTSGGANITEPSLADAEQEYVVGKVEYHSGVSDLISTQSADTTNSDTNTLDTTASTADLAGKYEYPNVRQNTSEMPPSNGEPRI